MTSSFRAEVHLFPTSQGGRVEPLPSGEWRTVFVQGESNWSGRMLYSGNPIPGDTFDCSVQLLVPEAYGFFLQGAEFTVWEAGFKGEGHVLASVGDNQIAPQSPHSLRHPAFSCAPYKLLEGIARGEMAVAEGRVVTHEQAKDRMARWFKYPAEFRTP